MQKGLNQKVSWELHQRLPIDESFDVVSTVFALAKGKGELIFVDGFAKDEVMEKIMEAMMKLDIQKNPSIPIALAEFIPYLEVSEAEDLEEIINSVLSGVLCFMVEGVETVCLIDARSYPTRSMQEPEDDRVLRGSRDAFVETLIFNTALIRRRIRDERLINEYHTVGEISKTDISICYLKDKVDQEILKKLQEKCESIEVEALTLSQESLAECLLPPQWWNPLPRIRYTERPDTACSSLLEGNILVLVDNSPSAMILPTYFLDFFQEANDYYFPPLVGTYLKGVRLFVFWLTLYFTPLWYAANLNPDFIPSFFRFVLVDKVASIPLLAQLLIIEIMIDGLKLASLNTPSSLSSAFSILGAVILGEYAVSTGWFNEEVILYMAFVALSNYAQPSFELGYSFKFFRIGLYFMVTFFQEWGIVLGTILIFLCLLQTETLKRNYLYPLYPWCGKKLSNLLIRKPLEHQHKPKK